ncbi:hypothetical protein L1787_20285 [Acuticoccus sp. M5D2P5]|uniref:hypothetical protein n=1 Tax=Acuticoccus kalidii TaxID=2910977 RepID=UPI001F194659|nr:hypothetical protein [Acuticoccus kalidii]MCF3935738.1 hypothetical protein [Acuticoccus kalidii]
MNVPLSAGHGRRPHARAFMRVCAALVWACELVNLLTGSSVAGMIAIGALLVFLVFAFLEIDAFTRAGAIFLVILGIGAVALGADPARALDRLWMATLIASFLVMLFFLRSTIAAHPALETVRNRFSAVDVTDRSGGILLVNHLLGSVLLVGVMSFFAPLVGDAPTSERRRAAELSVRGSSLIILWSPFTIGMATVTTNLPALPFWQIALAGAVITLVTFIGSLQLGEVRMRPSAMGAILVAVRPILVPICGLTAAIVLMGAVWDKPTLANATLVLLPFCALWALTMGPGTLKTTVTNTYFSLDRLKGELTLFTLALILAALILDIPALEGLLAGLEAQHLPIYPLIVAGGLLIGLVPLFGIHMIVPATIVLAIYQDIGTGNPMQDLVLAIFVLLGWYIGSVTGLGSLALLTATAVFRVPRNQLVLGSNLAFITCLFVGVSLAGAVFLGLVG